MYCPYCGQSVEQNATVCPHCNAQLNLNAQPNQSYGQYPYYPPQPQPQPSNGLAIAGFILAFFFPFIGFILSIVGLSRANKELNGSGRGLAIAGIVLSVIEMLSLFLIILFTVIWAAAIV